MILKYHYIYIPQSLILILSDESLSTLFKDGLLFEFV